VIKYKKSFLIFKAELRFIERQQMTTKREYLKSKGITVGRRGRFSGAAKVVLAEADKNGMKFTAEVPTKTK
jgi:hypothetical protein